jgi:hypothetical protein
VAWRWHHLAITMKKTDTDPARDGDLQQVRHLLQPLERGRAMGS